MNQEDFTRVFVQTMESTRKLLVVKGGEYAGSEDRLANFKRGAARVGIHPLQILWIYAAKHIDSIETYIRDEAAGVERERSEPITGRLDDLINYCILCKALILEKHVVTSGAESPVEPDRDLRRDRDRVPDQLVTDGLGRTLDMAQREAQPHRRDGHDDPVHHRQPDPVVLRPADVQPAARVADEVKRA